MDEALASVAAGAAGEGGAKPPRPKLSGWRRGLVIAGGVAAVLRVLLGLLVWFARQPNVVWPVKAGDTLAFRPGDANLAKWAEDPKSDALIVQKVIAGGEPAVPNTTMCVFDPGFVAATDAPGGTMTVEGHDLIVGWRVHWKGGDTVPTELKKPDYDPRCGEDTELLLTATQLHDVVNALAGLAQPPPEPDGVPVGTTIPLPQQ